MMRELWRRANFWQPSIFGQIDESAFAMHFPFQATTNEKNFFWMNTKAIQVN